MRRVWLRSVLLGLLTLAGCKQSGGSPSSPGGASAPATGVAAGRLTVLRGPAAVRPQGLAPAPLAPVVAQAPSVVQGPGASLREALAGTGPVPVARGERLVAGEVLVGLQARALEPAAVLRVLGEALGEGAGGLRPEHAGASTPTLHRVRFRHPDGRVPTVEETRQLAERLRGRKGVRYAVPERWLAPAATPDDPHFPLQWHFTAIGLPAAWDVANGAGSDVVVAVVDTGVRPHEDLSARLLPGVDTISEPVISRDGDGRDTDATDEGGDLPQGRSSWHGTHVAGTIAATTGNGQGVAGVSWGARLLPVRALGRGGGLLGDILAAMAWAVGVEVPGLPANPTPARVLNLSLGGDGPPNQAFQDVVDQAVARGAVVVVAAGNEAEDTARKFPCNQAGVVCVGATRLDGARALYTNHGDEVDLMAPGGHTFEDRNKDGHGDGVLSTLLDAQGRDTYDFMQGTSMSAPHVAGVVSLMLALRPALTPAEVQRLLADTASAVPHCSAGCGAGLLDAHAALLRVQGLQGPGGPGVLRLSPDSLVLAGSTRASLSLRNEGGAPLQVSASFTPRTGGARVSFPEGAALALPPGQTAPLVVEADVAGLSDGRYEGVLRLVPSVGDVQGVAVRILVGAAAQERPVRVAFLQEGTDGGLQVVAEVEAPAAGGYRYSAELRPGSYYVLATLDDDGDGRPLEPGEPVGFYPSLEDPRPVTVAAGETRAGLDFLLSPAASPAADGRLAVGAPCGTDADCPGGTCDTGVPGGYCTRACEDGGCPEGAACYVLGGAARVCLATCPGPGLGQGTCRAGQVCTEDALGGGTCLPACPAVACPAGTTCEVARGECVAGGPGGVGGPCSEGAACAGGVCFARWPGGYCSQACEGAACPPGATCYRFGGGAFCLKDCADPGAPEACRAGYRCVDNAVLGTPPSCEPL